jgi:hypothetical protein
LNADLDTDPATQINADPDLDTDPDPKPCQEVLEPSRENFQIFKSLYFVICGTSRASIHGKNETCIHGNIVTRHNGIEKSNLGLNNSEASHHICGFGSVSGFNWPGPDPDSRGRKWPRKI